MVRRCLKQIAGYYDYVNVDMYLVLSFVNNINNELSGLIQCRGTFSVPGRQEG